MFKSTFTTVIAFAALIALSSAAKVKSAHALKTTDRQPAICTAQSTFETAICVCFLNFSNSPQFAYFTPEEINPGRATCQAQFGSPTFILTQSAACNRYRQNLPSQDVNIFWLLGDANALLDTCAPEEPRLRFPGQPL